MTHAMRLLLFPWIFLLSLAYSVNIKIGVVLAVISIVPLVFVHFVEAGLLAVVFCIPFDRLLILGGGGSALTVTKILMLFAIAAWLLNVLIRKDATPLQSLYKRRTSILIIVYLVVSVVSLVNARDLDAGMSLLMRRTGVVVLYFVVINMVRSRQTLNRTINALLFASFFVGAIGMYEVVTGNQVLSEAQRGEDLAISQGTQRIQGCAGNADFHAGLLVMLLPLALVRASQAKGPRQIAVTYGLVLLYIVNVYATNTRLGVLGVFVSFAGILLLSEIRLKYLKLFGVCGALVCAIVLFVVIAPQKFSADRFTGEAGTKSLIYRIGWIEMSWAIVQDHPLMGIGLGNYFPEYNEYRRVAPYVEPMRTKNHNGFMQVWAEMGTIGLAAYLAFMLSVPLELMTSTRHQRGDKELKGLRNALLVAFFVYVLLIGIIPFLEHEVGWLNIGLAMSLGCISPRQPETVKSDSHN